MKRLRRGQAPPVNFIHHPQNPVDLDLAACRERSEMAVPGQEDGYLFDFRRVHTSGPFKPDSTKGRGIRSSSAALLRETKSSAKAR
jgi:hypothetical protein